MLRDAVNLPCQLSTLILLYGLLYARNTYWVIDIFCDPSLWLTDTGGGSWDLAWRGIRLILASHCRCDVTEVVMLMCDGQWWVGSVDPVMGEYMVLISLIWWVYSVHIVSIVLTCVLWWHLALIWDNESKMGGSNTSLLIILCVILNTVLSAVYISVRVFFSLWSTLVPHCKEKR